MDITTKPNIIGKLPTLKTTLAMAICCSTVLGSMTVDGVTSLQVTTPTGSTQSLYLGGFVTGTTLQNVIFWTAGQNRGRFESNGRLGIGLGTAAAAGQLHVKAPDFRGLILETSNLNSNVMFSGRPTGSGANVTFNSNSNTPITEANAGGFVFGSGNPEATGAASSVGTEILRLKRTGAMVVTSSNAADNAVTVTHPAGGNILVLRQGTNDRFLVDHYGQTRVTNALASGNALEANQSSAAGNIMVLRQGTSNRFVVDHSGTARFTAANHDVLRLGTTNGNANVVIQGNPTGPTDPLLSSGNTAFNSYGGHSGFIFGTGAPGTTGFGREVFSIKPNGTGTHVHLRGNDNGGASLRFHAGSVEQATLRTDLGTGDLVFQAGGVTPTAGPTEKMRLKADGTLTMNGTIDVGGVKTRTWTLAPDYVFEKDYKLRSLAEVEAFVQKNKHLPEVPSAKQFAKEGMDLAEMNFLLLKKVEELTLHAIRQEKRDREQERQIVELKRLLAVRRTGK